MNRFLEAIVSAKREEIVRRRAACPIEALGDLPGGARRPFGPALRGPGLRAIAEFKRRSPSRGVLREAADPGKLARAFAANGAAALSVLTDAHFFGGRDDDLLCARRAAALPVLRKDFVLDSYQLHEARALGADAVLLIARLLPGSRLRELVAFADELGLDALVEAHGEAELQRAVESGAGIVGINSRDLDTFETDLDATLALRPAVPAGCVAVAESAIRDRSDVERVAAAGFDAFLVGETLMRARDPGQALAALLGLNRALREVAR